MKLIKKTLLHYQKGTSNKVYNVYLIEISSEAYLVNFEYGRFGGNLKEGTKTKEPVDLAKAQKLYDSLVVSKMNKEYQVKEGFDSAKQEEKKEREVLTAEAYAALIVERLSRVGETQTTKKTTQSRANGATGFRALHASLVSTTTETTTLQKVDNYEVSRLIYRAGELKIAKAKALIVKIYEMNSDEDNAFYYSVTWALGRYRDPALRPIIESLREKLDKSSKYIVEEALFMLNEEQERQHIRALSFAMPYATSLAVNNHDAFVDQVKRLSEMIEQGYQTYKDADDWYDNEKTRAKQALMPLLGQADELYLKLYIWGVVDSNHYDAFLSIVPLLPVTAFNFSLYRRLYKMAEMREDQAVLGALVTLIESKKMGCYETYDYNSSEYRRSVGCSKVYFKKRSLRYVNDLSHYNPEGYIRFAKSVLLSVNHFPNAFEAFEVGHYDDNWNWKTKNYDTFATHLTFMKILYGAGKRYMIEPSKKQWEIANKSIKNEHRPELHPELWDAHIDEVVEILAESRVLEVQTFAFNVLKENPDALKNVPLEQLLQMMNLQHQEARELFFEILKEQYAKSQDPRIIKACLFSDDPKIANFALEIFSQNPEMLLMDGLIIEAIRESSEKSFDALVSLLPRGEASHIVVQESIALLMNLPLPLEANIGARVLKILIQLSQEMRSEDIVKLMSEAGFNERHKLGAYLIRTQGFEHLEIPLALKEKIAQSPDPEMLATTIYLLGKLSDEELMNASDMLISFLYHPELAVHQEAGKIIARLGQAVSNGNQLLQAIVERSFASASDEVAENIEQSVKALEKSYATIAPDQLYRMLIAKSKLAVRLGGLILTHYQATDFSVLQWARLAKNPNKTVRVWAYDAYMNNESLVKEAMPKSLMIFDTIWEDTRAFASGYFEGFELSSDEIVVVADSNYPDVQRFAKQMIERGEYDREVILTKLSQHPAVTIQKFVTDLMLAEMSDAQLLKMERFFNTLLHAVNQNRVAKTRVMKLLKARLENREIAEMVARLASHHSATMVWADKTLFVEIMSQIAEVYADIALPLVEEEIEVREVV